jgi:hypothetical protein
MTCIRFSLFATHISGGDHANQLLAHREGDEQKSPRIGLAQAEEPILCVRMGVVLRGNERPVEEDLLALARSDLVLQTPLVDVTGIPLKAYGTGKALRNHHEQMYIPNVYRRQGRRIPSAERTS